MGKNEFSRYYKDKEVTDTYDTQREGTKYRREKRKIELQIFLELLDKKEGEEVLEIGASSGALTKYLKKVVAVDTNSEMLKLTKQKNPQANCICADMFKLPFQDKLFDKVITIRVWTHLDEKELREALKESRRVLKDKGIIVFDVEEHNPLRRFVHFFYKRLFSITGYKICPYRLSHITKIITEEGFDVEQIKFLKHRIGRQIILKVRKR